MSIINLRNRNKILFISVSTFNYERAIKTELENKGFEVDLYDERPSNSIFTKGLIRLKKSWYGYYLKNYYKRIISEISNKEYDFLFILKGESVPLFFIEEFKVRFPAAHLIFYTWDSFKNNANPLIFLHLFDKCFTFDHGDAIKYKLIFRPLFYLNQYSALKNIKAKRYEFDLLFIGTAHTDRYAISSKVVEICKNYEFSSYAYYYIQGKLVFLFKRLFDKSFKYFDKDKVSFRSLSLNQTLSLFSKSNVILDIHHSNQNGLTMRTYEALGAGKKIITTNQEIKRYKFYNISNILVIDRNDVKIDKSFFNSSYMPIEKEIYAAMSLNGWINSIFNLENINEYWFK
jgi:hypothetical protein